MNEIEKNFIEPYDFLYYFSPTIPYNFPKEQIPPNLCETELLSVIKCYSDHPQASDQMKRGYDCHKFASEFNECKKRRDLHLFNAIQSWESSHFRTLRAENRSVYLKNLAEEKQELEKSFNSVPASEGSAEKRWRLYTDLIQTRWRLSYLEKLIN